MNTEARIKNLHAALTQATLADEYTAGHVCYLDKASLRQLIQAGQEVLAFLKRVPTYDET